jgi:hypothetical protein
MAAQPATSASAPVAQSLPPVPAARIEEEKPPPCSKLGWVDACLPAAPRVDGSRLSADEVGAWCAHRNAKPPKELQEATCDLAHVGPDREEALACTRTRQPAEASTANVGHVIRLAVDWMLVAVRSRRAETLVSIRRVVDVLDKPEPSGPLFAMGVVLDAGGQRIAVMEPGENACAQAKTYLASEQKQVAANQDADARRAVADWARFDAKLLDGMCTQPRLWIWRGGRFAPPVAGGTGVVSSKKSSSTPSTHGGF